MDLSPDPRPLLAQRLLARRWRLVTAESCTGGMIAAACTDLAGSSQWFERGFVTYSNEAKTELLEVSPALLAAHGAVSAATAEAMVTGALKHAHAEVALAVTGIAGPGGGSVEKPVGTVWFAWQVAGRLWSEYRCFDGDRAAVRQRTLAHALQTLLDACG